MLQAINDRLKHWWLGAKRDEDALRVEGCACPETYPRVCCIQGMTVVLHRYGCSILPIRL